MRRLLLIITVLIAATDGLLAQSGYFDYTPKVLYPSDNVITITASAGIRRITQLGSSPYLTVEGAGAQDCERQVELRVHLSVAHLNVVESFEVVDCRNERYNVNLRIYNTWNLETKRFGGVPVGERRCVMFKVEPQSGAEILDSVTVDDPRVSLRFFTDLPYRIRGSQLYQYEVCFTADEPGIYKFPVVTWIRRAQPSGGLTTYPVADTGIVVVPAPLEPVPIPVADPTTFRTIAVPNAVIPPKGRAFVGVYDVLGVVAGYSITDNVMLLGGGALPLPDDWGGVRGQMFGAASIGVKAGVALSDEIDVALGYQFGASLYDEERTRDEVESQITVHAPWGAISYGDDDSRASLTLGYAFKRHVKPLIEFDENALIVGLGGDYRFANNWKVAGEVAYMQTLGVLPIVATARYFTDTYAIDAGLGFAGFTLGNAAPAAVPVIPLISGVVVF
jgi:hypothetical protein